MAKKKTSLARRINILRASVMGANDGIISVAGIVIGVAAATSNSYAILIAGLSGGPGRGDLNGNGGIRFGFYPKGLATNGPD